MGTLRYLLLPSQQVQSIACSQCQRMVQVMGSQSRLNSASPDLSRKPAQYRPVAYLLSHARQTETQIQTQLSVRLRQRTEDAGASGRAPTLERGSQGVVAK